MVIENGTGLGNFLKTQVRFKTSMGFYHSAWIVLPNYIAAPPFLPLNHGALLLPLCHVIYFVCFFFNLGFSLNADRNLGFGLITYWMLGFYLIASVVDI